MPGSDSTGDHPRSDGKALVLGREQVRAVGLPLSERRIRLPSSAPRPAVRHLELVVKGVNNGAGLWARAGGRIGNSEVRALRVRRSPTEDEVLHGADPEVLRQGYEALAMLFEHSSLDVQTEIYRRLSRRRPWWAWLDVFGWFRGARVREHVPTSREGRFDLIRFARFIEQYYPRLPQLTPEQLHQVRDADDYQRFIGKQVDLWGVVEDVHEEWYTRSKRLSWSTRVRAGRDRKGRPKYRTTRTSWTVDIPAVRVEVTVRGEESMTVTGIYTREGDAHATGHYSHYTVNPDLPVFRGGREFLRGQLTRVMTLAF